MKAKRFLSSLLTVAVVLSSLSLNVFADSDNDEGINGFIKRMYDVCLDRTPDSNGLNYWAGLLKDKEATGCSVASGFVYSPEFQNKKCTNEQYVSYMYSAFFGREAEKEGMEYWVTAIDNGMTRDSVFSGFTNSKEFGDLCDSYGVIRGCYVEGFDIDKTVMVNLFVERLYNVVLDRHCDNDGMTYWTLKLVNREDTGAGVASGFVFSPEFINKNYCDMHYVEMLYASFMGREPEEGGIEYWCSVLSEGDTRENVFNGFACSKEFNDICSSYGIESGFISASGSGTHANGKCVLCEASNSGNSNVVTNMPTKAPTSKPVVKPTSVPAAKPTSAIVTKPSAAPTNKPASVPTNKPTVTPTKAPEITKPTNTPNPTVAPTAVPTATPTTVPTAAPITSNPTVAPTTVPTSVPTAIPTPTPVTGLVQKDGEYYYYNSDGSLATGWVNINGATYYFNPAALKGWEKYGSNWYFFDYNNGQMHTGYLSYLGNLYYLNEDGTMHTGWYKFGGGISDYYYFDPVDGNAVSGWVLDGDDYYYMDPKSFKMMEDWQYIDGNWYYLSKFNGRMLHDSLLVINSSSSVETYYLDSSGAMVTGWKFVNNNWYYFQDSGAALSSGEYKVGGDYYYFDSEARMLSNGYANGHYYGSNGARVY